MAVNRQVTSLEATPRTEAEPASLMTKRRSTVPFDDFCVPVFGSSSPPVATTSRSTCPVARITSVLPAGTDIAVMAGTGSPVRRPGRITGGLPV